MARLDDPMDPAVHDVYWGGGRGCPTHAPCEHPTGVSRGPADAGREAEAVRRLSAAVDDRGTQRGLAHAMRHLLMAHEFGAQIVRADRVELQTYADACGATGGEPDVGAAIETLLGSIDRRGVFLGKVSFAHESAGAEAPDGVRVDLDVVLRSCDEAIARRPCDGSVPRVIIGADALSAIASSTEALADEASRLLSEDPSPSPRLARWVRLARLAARGPVVTGPAANDAWGEVVYPCYGHPLNDDETPPKGGATRVASEIARAVSDLGAGPEAYASLREEVIAALRYVAGERRGRGEAEEALGERLKRVAERLAAGTPDPTTTVDSIENRAENRAENRVEDETRGRP